MIESLRPHLNGIGGLMGLDVGDKTIGVALSDTRYQIATPRTVLRRRKFSHDAHALAVLMREINAVGLIIGLPINMDGSEGPRAQSTRAFVHNLGMRADFANMACAFWDERLSTQAVTRTMLAADLSRARRAKLVDKLAATYILQGALDYLRLHKGK